MKLSIIVPIYNMEAYIRPCLESIFRQGLDECDFEVLLVNDGTTDSSMEMVADLVAAHANVRVMEQENQGLSAARNTGMDNALGRFIMFLDSDDLFVDHSLASLLNVAIDHDADMTVASFVKMDEEEIGKIGTAATLGGAGGGPEGEVCVTTGRDVFLHVFNPRECYVWRMIYKRSFLDGHRLRFIPGIYFEDIAFTTECYLRAGKCVLSPKVIYIYRQRPNSIVYSVNMKKLLDMNVTLEHLYKIKGILCTTAALRRRMDDTIFSTFSIAIWYLTHDKALYAEKEKYIGDLRRKLPRMHFTHGLKQRFVSTVFHFIPNVYVWLRARFD